MTRRIVITDGLADEWARDARELASGDDDWTFAVLGLGTEAFRAKHCQSLAELRHWRLFDVSQIAAAAADDAADLLDRLLPQLPHVRVGGHTLADILRAHDGTLWWSLEFTEKSPFRGRLVERLYRLAVLDRALAEHYDEVWLSLEDALLDEVIGRSVGREARSKRPPRRERRSTPGLAASYWRAAISELRQQMALMAASRAIRWATPRHAGLFFFTFFPAWWLDGDRPHERFFAQPPNGAHFIAWLSDTRSIARLARRHDTSTSQVTAAVVPLQRYIRMADLAGVLSPARWRRCRRAAKWSTHLSWQFKRFEIGPLIAEDIRNSLTSTQFHASGLIERAIARFSEEVRPAAIVYRLEHQVFERALLSGARGRTVTIGYDHGAFGPAYTPLRFLSGELARNPNEPPEPLALPLPDGMLVTGPGGRSRLSSQGYPIERIAICGPQRHPDLILARSRGIHGPEPDTAAVRLLVALGIIDADTESLFAALAEAVDPPLGSISVRLHPNRPADQTWILSLMPRYGLPQPRFVPSDRLHEEIARTHILLTVGSILAFEAIALGVMPIVFDNPGTYPATSLRDYSHSLYVARVAPELRRAINEIRERREGFHVRRKQWDATLTNVFADLDTPLPVQLGAALASLGVGSIGEGSRPEQS